MSPRASTASPRAAEAARLIFPWRGSDGSAGHKFLAIVIVGLVFVAGFAFLRVRVLPPEQTMERKASVILLPPDGDGRLWTSLAREGGPFPSRFDPRDWEDLSGLGGAVANAARSAPVPYVPRLRELPADEALPAEALAPGGERVFPRRTEASPPPGPPVKLVPGPVLYPLTGMPLSDLPKELPPFEGAVDGTMASTDWRFLLRLAADGSVVECVSLAGISGEGSSELENWLRRVKFAPAVAARGGRIAIAVGFINQPAHGPDAR